MAGPTRKFGDWDKAEKMLKDADKRAKDAFGKALLQEGQFIRGQMVDGITAQAPGGEGFKPLSAATLAARKLAGFKGTKALIRHGDLRNSITVIKDGDDVFIGVPRTARQKNGKGMIDLAKVHEFGAGPFVVTITAKMRRFLFGVLFKKEQDNGGIDKPFWLLKGSGKKTISIKIPARPFIRPVWKQHGQPAQLRARLEERMAKILKGGSSK